MSKQKAPYPIGIDFGTSSSTAAWIDGYDKLRHLVGRHDAPFIPSVVWFGQSEHRRVGWDAIRMLEDDPKNTVTDFKRLLGRFFHAPDMKKYLVDRAVRAVSDVDGFIALDAGTRVQSVEHATAEVYQHIRSLTQIQSGLTFDTCVLTVPTNFGLLQRKTIRQAAQACPWDVKALINEPTAAAFSFLATQEINGRVLVFDLGGGTLDLTLLERRGGSVNIIATGGDEFLGGRDLENRVTQWVASEYLRKTGFDTSQNKPAFERLNAATRRAMHLLDQNDTAMIQVSSLGIHERQIVDLSTTLTREHLELISAPFFNNIRTTVFNLFSRTGLDIRTIDHVVFVGAATRSPLLRKRVLAWTDGASTTNIDPRIAVACGAALIARHLDTDGLNISYDVITKDVHLYADDGMDICVIPRQTRVPFETQVRLPLRKHDGHFFIGERDDKDADKRNLIGMIEIPSGFMKRRIKEVVLNVTLDRTFQLSVMQIDQNGRQRKLEVQHPFDIAS